MEPSREQALWAGVLGQAILDATNRASFNAREYRDGDPRVEALAWISSNSEDFRTVATLAGLDPDGVRAAVMSGRVGPLHLSTDRPRPRASKAKVQGRAA